MTTAAPLKAPKVVQAVRHGVEVPGYLVGDDGLIYSLWTPAGTGRIGWEIGTVPRALSAYPIGRNGAYLGVAFRRGGRTVRASVHAVVMESFGGPCPVGHEVCHEDGNGHNNRLDNLRYGTKSSNQADKRRHGTHQDGERNACAKLTDTQVDEMRHLRSAGMKLRELAERFGVSESTVSRIANRVRRTR